MDKKEEQIKEYLKGLSDSELLSIYNDYADASRYEQVFTMDEFDEICENMDASDIARRIYHGDFNPNDEYFMFNGYANFISTDDLADFIDFDDLADYCIRNDEDFDDQEIRDTLDADDTTEDTED